MTVAASKGVAVASLSAANTGTGNSIAIPNTSKNPRVHVKGTGVINSGTLILEEAETSDYTGTWSQLQSINLVALTGGACQIIHIIGVIGFIRGRLSANVVGGGNVTVEIISD